VLPSDAASVLTRKYHNNLKRDKHFSLFCHTIDDKEAKEASAFSLANTFQGCVMFASTYSLL